MSMVTKKDVNCASLNHAILPYHVESEYYVENLGAIARKPIYSFVKRSFDVIASLVSMFVLFIPMVIIAIVICATSKGGAIYTQDRLGLNGKPIKIIKFRSMIRDAEKDGAQWSAGKSDPRITKIGHFLRSTHLDELPQLWCILKGDMSFVGPRPEREIFYDKFEEYIHGFKERLKVKPGLTGLAQVNGGYYLKPEEKVKYDVEYIKNRSLWLDLKVIFETFKVVFAREGAK